jgi:iron complex outermembrane receptor protein
MKKSRYAVLILTSLILFDVTLLAQVKGRVISAPGTSIPYVNVLLIQSSDSSLVKGTTTDESGMFLLDDIVAGNYRLRISCLGYQKTFTEPFSLTNAAKVFNAGDILLKPEPKSLNNVEIVAERQFIERRIDRMVVNIDKSIVSSGSDALEIFKRLPGVSVSQDGTISLKNKQGVLILINGRPSNLAPADLATLLKSMNADQIEKIEIMVNPPAKYDAAGSAGVINIVMKKNQALGLNGSVHGGGLVSNEKVFPVLARTGDVGFNLNYRTAKWNFFGSYDYSSVVDGWATDITNRFYSNSRLQSTLTQHMVQEGTADNQFAKLGVDYQLSSRQTLGFLCNVRDIHGVASNSLNYIVLSDSSGRTTGGINSYFNVYEPIQSDDANLYYNFKIDSTGKEFTVNADYLYYLNPNEHNLYYYSFDANNQYLPPFQHIVSKQINNITIASLKADYTHTFGKKIKMDAGMKTAQVKSDNDGHYWNVIGTISYPDAGMTNHFIYTENINAGYLNYSQELNDKLSVQAGLRGEQSNVKGELVTRDTAFSHTYLDLFPSLFINWKANSKNTFNISYSKRIDRPDYVSVNPFLYARGPYTFNSGNASLRPQYTNGVEFTHVYKGLLNTTLGYSRTSDAITEVSRQDDATHITYNMPVNLNTVINYNFNTALSYPLTKWWTTTNSISVFYKQYEGSWQGADVNQAMLSAAINTQNSFRLGKRWNVEASALYVTKQANGISVTNPFCIVDAGIQLKFAEERGTVKLNAGDLLWAHFETDTKYQNMDISTVFYANSRFLHLGLTWKLGSSTSAYQNKNRAAAEELNRIKN